jgi:hypothetical protein
MNSTRIRSGLAVAVIGVALFATLGEATKTDTSTGNQAPNAGATSGPTASSGGGGAAPTTASSKATPIPVGTAVEVAKGWTVKVNLANLDADALLAQSNQFNKPQPGEKFVLVNVTITNGGDKPEAAFTSLKLSYLPPSGIAVSGLSSCLVSAPDKIDSMAQMHPGAVATGNLCFSVKIADIPNGLLLGEPQFTLDTNKDQQFFALA